MKSVHRCRERQRAICSAASALNSYWISLRTYFNKSSIVILAGRASANPVSVSTLSIRVLKPTESSTTCKNLEPRRQTPNRTEISAYLSRFRTPGLPVRLKHTQHTLRGKARTDALVPAGEQNTVHAVELLEADERGWVARDDAHDARLDLRRRAEAAPGDLHHVVDLRVQLHVCAQP